MHEVMPCERAHPTVPCSFIVLWSGIIMSIFSADEAMAWGLNRSKYYYCTVHMIQCASEELQVEDSFYFTFWTLIIFWGFFN